MLTYLITFQNVFDHTSFKNEIDNLFYDKSNFKSVPVLISYSSKFCIIELKSFGQGYISKLKLDYPGIKILLKQHIGKKVKYIEL